MMHQPIDPPRDEDVRFDDRPDHPLIIQNDEVLDLTIDLETLSTEEVFVRYFER